MSDLTERVEAFLDDHQKHPEHYYSPEELAKFKIIDEALSTPENALATVFRKEIIEFMIEHPAPTVYSLREKINELEKRIEILEKA